jgi:hypothetical protein
MGGAGRGAVAVTRLQWVRTDTRRREEDLASIPGSNAAFSANLLHL